MSWIKLACKSAVAQTSQQFRAQLATEFVDNKNNDSILTT
jgi:hypothetical protein